MAPLCQALRAGFRVCTDIEVRTGASSITRNFRREDFDRCWTGGGNKTTATCGSDDRRVAISAAASTRLSGGTILLFCSSLGETMVSTGAEGLCDMRKFSSLLRSAPSRIGRRIALTLAIPTPRQPAGGHWAAARDNVH